MRGCLILIFCGVSVFAAKPERAAVETFVQEYIAKVARGDASAVSADAGFKDRLDEDAEEFAECGKSGCRPRFRATVNPRDDDDEEGDSSAADDDLFEVQMDVVKGDKIIVRRSGCYLVSKRGEKLIMHDYKYECAE